MSDVDPELPDFLVDAILSSGPPPDAVDLVKNAFTWRTVEAELMELSYDSAIDTAGVRDGSGRRTLEFSSTDLTMIIEVDGLRLTGQVTPMVDGQVTLRHAEETHTAPLAQGRFEITTPRRGPASVELQWDGGQIATPMFTIA